MHCGEIDMIAAKYADSIRHAFPEHQPIGLIAENGRYLVCDSVDMASGGR
jgi:hypothetical protein